MSQVDAIVAGSGITGGWAAKELTERGLRVLMIERGPMLEHRKDYKTEFTPPWDLPFRGYGDPKMLATSKRIQQHAWMNEWTQQMFVDDDVDIYESPPESNFQWLRGYHLGGRSLMWGRHSYRMSPLHFQANALDGHGSPWPVSYEDIAPWYDHVERFIGVNGTVDNIPTLPDGVYQPSMGLNAAEQRLAEVVRAHYSDRRLLPGRTANLTEAIGDRTPCQFRDQCARGCSYGAYFSTQSSTLPAARATGRLTLLTDTIVDSLEFDPATRRATAVRLVDAISGKRSTVHAPLVFLCTGSVNTVSLLLRSTAAAAPGGLGNSSDLLGRYFMDHVKGDWILSSVPGIEDQMYLGRRPNGIVMPRFINVDKKEVDFIRGYSYQGGSGRTPWTRGAGQAGIGKAFKQGLEQPGDWGIALEPNVECLPNKDNRITINSSRTDKYGLPITRIDLRWGENERKAAAHARREAAAMLSLLGGQVITWGTETRSPGLAIHEMGGACMGADPQRSVTNAHNQLHDAPNVFVTDGAFMSSSGDRNPSLTYMAFTVRAAAHAADLLKHHAI